MDGRRFNKMKKKRQEHFRQRGSTCKGPVAGGSKKKGGLREPSVIRREKKRGVG